MTEIFKSKKEIEEEVTLISDKIGDSYKKLAEYFATPRAEPWLQWRNILQYGRFAVVNMSGPGDFGSLDDAVVLEGTVEEPLGIIVCPGDYWMEACEMGDYVNVFILEPSNTTFLGDDNTYPLLKCNVHNKIYGLNINNIGSAAAISFVNPATEGANITCEFHNCRFKSNGIAVSENTGLSNTYYHKNLYMSCHFDSVGTVGLWLGSYGRGESRVMNCVFRGQMGINVSSTSRFIYGGQRRAVVSGCDIFVRHYAITTDTTNSFEDNTIFISCRIRGQYCIYNPLYDPTFHDKIGSFFYGCYFAADEAVVYTRGCIHGLHFENCDLRTFSASAPLFKFTGANQATRYITMKNCTWSANFIIENTVAGYNLAIYYHNVDPLPWYNMDAGQPDISFIEKNQVVGLPEMSAANDPLNAFIPNDTGFLYSKDYSDIIEAIFRDVNKVSGDVNDIRLTRRGDINFLDEAFQIIVTLKLQWIGTEAGEYIYADEKDEYEV